MTWWLLSFSLLINGLLAWRLRSLVAKGHETIKYMLELEARCHRAEFILRGVIEDMTEYEREEYFSDYLREPWASRLARDHDDGGQR